MLRHSLPSNIALSPQLLPCKSVQQKQDQDKMKHRLPALHPSLVGSTLAVISPTTSPKLDWMRTPGEDKDLKQTNNETNYKE